MFISLLMLAVESNAVIVLRTAKLIFGGGDALHEGGLMVSEKIDAAFEATASLMGGASANTVIERYRHHVAANAKRLRS
jgi:hypothetical protein